jgi:pilus assembly protein FimV
MIITCENCHASYKLDDSVLDPAGSRVRCTNCGHVFIAKPSPAVSSSVDAQAAEPEESLTAGGVDDSASFTFEGSPSPEKGVEAAFQYRHQDMEDDETGPLAVDENDGMALDLDLDLDFDETEEGTGAITEDFQELDLELDLEPVTTEVQEETGRREGPDAELDLQEIQKMLAIDDEAYESSPLEDQRALGGDSEALPDLDLDLGKPESAMDAASSEELDLDLNLDLNEPEGLPKSATIDEQGSDLDLELDFDNEPTEALSETRDNGLGDLDLDLEPLSTEPMQTETEVFEEQELDLGDIDLMLHTDEEAVVPSEGGAQEESGRRMRTDLVGKETAEIAADLARPKASETEVDVYGEESGAPRDRAGDEALARLGEIYTLRTSTNGDGQISVTAEAEPVGHRKPLAGSAKRRFPWLWMLLVLLGLVGGGVYWAWQQGFDTDFFKQLLGQQTTDEAGNLKISTLAIDSRFVDNATAGRLFVITGKARNDYDHPRSQIQIKGSLLATGKAPVGSETVFCGNVLTDLDLSRLEVAEIKRRLSVKTGADNQNVNVPSGGLVPFMVVFSNLPPDLEEFTIEVVDSR